MARRQPNAQTKQLQDLFDKYERAHPDANVHALDEVFQWATVNGLYEMPREEPSQTFRRKMAKALAQKHRTDAQGRRHRAKLPITVQSGGKQLVLWADIDKMPREAFQKNVAQRRNQIVGDCVQLSFDVDHYNEQHSDAPSIQVHLDFQEDVEERMFELNPPD